MVRSDGTQARGLDRRQDGVLVPLLLALLVRPAYEHGSSAAAITNSATRPANSANRPRSTGSCFIASSSVRTSADSASRLRSISPTRLFQSSHAWSPAKAVESVAGLAPCLECLEAAGSEPVRAMLATAVGAALAAIAEAPHGAHLDGGDGGRRGLCQPHRGHPAPADSDFLRDYRGPTRPPHPPTPALLGVSTCLGC
jgi:hypothetical protein